MPNHTCTPHQRLAPTTAFMLVFFFVPISHANAQAPRPGYQTAASTTHASSAVANTATASTPDPPATAASSWVVRDPRTGRLYRQQLVSVNVPRTEWTTQPEVQRVYETKWVQQIVPTQDTIYTPKTSYVTQPKIKGWWNPLSPNVVAYEQVPVTTWEPKTTTVNQSVYVPQWVPTNKTVYVAKPVQRTDRVQQIVQTEIPQLNTLPRTSPPTALASAPIQFATRPPLISIPLLGRASRNFATQPMVQPPSYAAPPRNPIAQPSGVTSNQLAASSVSQAPKSTSTSTSSSWMRPIERATSAAFGRQYDTALRSSAVPPANFRTATESGMRATVLR